MVCMAMEEEGKGPPGAPVRGRILMQHLGALLASNSGIIVGLALGWSSAAEGVSEGEQGFPVTLEEWSWISSMFGIGAAIGNVFIGKLLQPLGRRFILCAISPVTFLAFALLHWATGVWMLYAGRLLVGIAGGMACIACPIYICEMSQPDIRGMLSTYFEVQLCFGIFVVYLFGKLMSLYWLNVSCLAIAVLHLVGFVWFPDTPRWFLLHGQPDQARKALVFYRGPDYDVDAELQLIQKGIQESDDGEVGWSAFTTPAARKGLTICIMLFTFMQLVGVNAITFYASQLFKDAGSFDERTASIVVALTEVVAAVLSMFFVDRLGRRLLLLLSLLALTACTGLLGGYFYAKDTAGLDVSDLKWLPIVVASTYMFMFSIGLGPVSWVIVGEVFPDSIKGMASAVSSSAGWLSAFLVTKFYPGLADSLGNAVCYWFFFACCVFIVLFIFFFVPETKGRTLDEIQADLSGAKRSETKQSLPD